MGNPHPVENGFSWHPTLAVPYLAGSAVKGLVRAWVEMDEYSAKKARLKHWFGTEDKKDVAEQAGNFIFFDAIPHKVPELICDIMTPHMGDWYEQGNHADRKKPNTIPADWHEPVPVPFLAVKNAEFIFSIAARTKDAQAELNNVFNALKNALEWLGAGAKTAAGYGYMEEIPYKPKPSSTNLLDALIEMEEKDLILAFSKNYNKTKESCEQKGHDWQELINIVWLHRAEKINDWEGSNDKNTKKAYQKLKAERDE
jgi:CRISPR-associated protein Cmr6